MVLKLQYDHINMFKKLTLLRIWNAVQIVSSYHLSRITQKARHWGMPMSISIEPTTSCNLRCPECPSGLRSFTRPIGMLDQDHFKIMIDELASRLTYLTFYFQGEPYLNPKFLDMVKYASGKGIYTATSTNAHYLNDNLSKKTIASGLDRLIISIDGTTQETYESYRIGGKLDKVLEGTANIVKWKKELKSQTPHIIFQFLVVKPNEHQIDEVYKIAKEMGVDEVKLKTAQIYDFEGGSPLIPDNSKFSRYAKQPDGKYKIKNELLSHCWKMWNSCVLTWDGRVVPCCFDKDASHELGQVTAENSFQKVWRSPKYDSFRSSLLRSRSEIEICKNCTEGTEVFV